jgi:hypothetical protein
VSTAVLPVTDAYDTRSFSAPIAEGARRTSDNSQTLKIAQSGLSPTQHSNTLILHFALCLVSLLDSLIQRLQHAGIHRGDDVHRRVQFFIAHTRFPCIRKAPFYSGIAEAHHRHGKTDEHLFSLAEAFYGMGVTIKGPKISFLQFRIILGPPF